MATYIFSTCKGKSTSLEILLYADYPSLRILEADVSKDGDTDPHKLHYDITRLPSHLESMGKNLIEAKFEWQEKQNTEMASTVHRHFNQLFKTIHKTLYLLLQKCIRNVKII